MNEAARRNDVPALEEFLQKGASVDTVNAYGNTPLHDASLVGGKEAVTFLLEHGGSIDKKNYRGHTPLWEAATSGQASTVEILLAHGADPRITSPSGRTLLEDVQALRAGGPDYEKSYQLVSRAVGSK